MDIKRLANSGALKTRVYVTGKSKKEVERELHLSNTIKMASNENPLGASGRAKEAIVKTLDQINMYPHPTSLELREKLSRILGCTPNEITIGNGADGVIYNLGMAVIDQDDEVIIPEITFPVYETIIKVMRGKPVYTKMKDLKIDLEDIKKNISKKTRAIFICNPNNPTGDALPKEQLLSFLKDAPGHILIVLDEAYIDFADEGMKPDSIRLFKEGMDNLFILRTLSKIYGLAGIRVGFGIGFENLISLINRVKPPFDVSIIAESAAIDALSDHRFIRETLEESLKEKKFFYRELDKLNLKYIKSHTNFILIDTGFDSQEIFNRMLKKGIIVRPGKNYALPFSIRVTIGKHEENLVFFSALSEVLAGLSEISSKMGGL